MKVSSEALLIMDLVRIKFYFQKIMTYMLWSWFFNGQHKMVETYSSLYSDLEVKI